jgi:LemA protein
MMQTIIAVLVIIAVFVLWVLSTQRRLVILDENISNSMNQIGVQLSSRFDALMAILNLIKEYETNECEPLIEMVRSRRRSITAKSTPDEVLRQEGIISMTLGRIAMITEQYPDLKVDYNYIKAMDAVEIYESMLRTSRLIYNDSITKLNREIRMFPVSMVAGMLGYHQREYMEEQTADVVMPSMR